MFQWQQAEQRGIFLLAGKSVLLWFFIGCSLQFYVQNTNVSGSFEQFEMCVYE